MHDISVCTIASASMFPSPPLKIFGIASTVCLTLLLFHSLKVNLELLGDKYVKAVTESMMPTGVITEEYLDGLDRLRMRLGTSPPSHFLQALLFFFCCVIIFLCLLSPIPYTTECFICCLRHLRTFDAMHLPFFLPIPSFFHPFLPYISHLTSHRVDC